MKMENSEKNFIVYIDHKGCPIVFLEQSLEFQSQTLCNNYIKRPDFIVAFTRHNRSIKIDPIHVDTKELSFDEKYQTFTFETLELQGLRRWQEAFNAYIWFAIAIKNFGYKTWFWISLNDVIAKHFDIRKNGGTGKEFYVIKVENCITIGWNDTLNKLFY